MELRKNYINGEWIPALSGKTRKILNPANGEVIAETAEGNEEDVKLAVAAAKEAFYGTGEWRRMDSQKRADIILTIAAIMEERKEELARTDTLDNGKP